MIGEGDRVRLLVSSAILTRNRRELEWAVAQPESVVGHELLAEARTVLTAAPVPGRHLLVELAGLLPSRLQYIGQRAILLLPRASRRLLRSSGLHHRMF